MLQGIIISHDLVCNMPQRAKLLGGDNPLSCCFNERIPNGAQYVTLQIYFSHPSLVIYFFPITPVQIELALNRSGRPLIANHLNQTDWLANQKQGPAVRLYSLHSSLGVVCCALYHVQKTMQKCWAKTILDFSLPKCFVQGHILSTAGDATCKIVRLENHKTRTVVDTPIDYS
jgi:hypothetical protein